MVDASDPRRDLQVAFELADLASAISLPAFHAQRCATRVKDDGSPVTDTDIEVETALLRHLGQKRPQDMVIGEECGRSGVSHRRWYLDPIDGTSRFIAQDPAWMTLIALAVDDEVTVGVVDLPARGERWWASRGGGAFRNGQRITVSARQPLGRAIVNDSWREDLKRGNREHPLWTVAQHAGAIRPHQGHSMLAVASGAADVAIQIKSHAWDYAALKIIVQEAGGTFTDRDGHPRIDTGSAVATNGRLHPAVLTLLNPRR